MQLDHQVHPRCWVATILPSGLDNLRISLVQPPKVVDVLQCCIRRLGIRFQNANGETNNNDHYFFHRSKRIYFGAGKVKENVNMPQDALDDLRGVEQRHDALNFSDYLQKLNYMVRVISTLGLMYRSARGQSCPLVARRQATEEAWALCRPGDRRREAWLTEGRAKLYIKAP